MFISTQNGALINTDRIAAIREQHTQSDAWLDLYDHRNDHIGIASVNWRKELTEAHLPVVPNTNPDICVVQVFFTDDGQPELTYHPVVAWQLSHTVDPVAYALGVGIVSDEVCIGQPTAIRYPAAGGGYNLVTPNRWFAEQDDFITWAKETKHSS